MRYLCLIYGGGMPDFAASPRAGLDPAIRSSFYPVGTGAEAVTIRLRNDDLLVLEGSTARIGDPLPEFLIVEAIDLNDAIRIASSHPAVAAGMTAELRPVRSVGARDGAEV